MESNAPGKQQQDATDKPRTLCSSCTKLDMRIVLLAGMPKQANFCSYNMFGADIYECEYYEREVGSDD